MLVNHRMSTDKQLVRSISGGQSRVSKQKTLDGKCLKRSGERGRNRTYNLLIKSQLLCQLSYAPGPFVCIDWWEIKRAGLFGTFQ
jgi:hypothetical protein